VNTFDQAAPAKVTLNCDSEVVILDLDVVTALGIVVAEPVSNSYDHAFPNGMGMIDVSVRRDPGNNAMANLVIKDDGQGFEPISGSKRHGVGLVRRLAEQVRGTANVASSTWRDHLDHRFSYSHDGKLKLGLLE
jgi:two-component sensor histidine kinase